MSKRYSAYQLIDSGNGQKLERFGEFSLVRPCAQAVWDPLLPEKEWEKADAFFSRDGGNRWAFNRKLPEKWIIDVDGIKFQISPTDFGHLGIFAEQRDSWHWIGDQIIRAKAEGRESVEILNLFAYSGGSTLAAAKAGAKACHLDASKGMVSWARENAQINGLEQAPIRWIVEDVQKFLDREVRRGRRYDGIILDPPSFGRGGNGELFKIERDLPQILKSCRQLLSERPLFLLLSCHTPGYTPLVLTHILNQKLQGLGGKIEEGDMLLYGSEGVLPIPSGTYARWFRNG